MKKLNSIMFFLWLFLIFGTGMSLPAQADISTNGDGTRFSNGAFKYNTITIKPNTAPQNAPTNEVVGLVRFPVEELAGKTIETAKLKLFVKSSKKKSQYSLIIRPTTADFSESWTDKTVEKGFPAVAESGNEIAAKGDFPVGKNIPISIDVATEIQSYVNSNPTAKTITLLVRSGDGKTITFGTKENGHGATLDVTFASTASASGTKKYYEQETHTIVSGGASSGTAGTDFYVPMTTVGAACTSIQSACESVFSADSGVLVKKLIVSFTTTIDPTNTGIFADIEYTNGDSASRSCEVTSNGQPPANNGTWTWECIILVGKRIDAGSALLLHVTANSNPGITEVKVVNEVILFGSTLLASGEISFTMGLYPEETSRAAIPGSVGGEGYECQPITDAANVESIAVSPSSIITLKATDYPIGSVDTVIRVACYH